MPLNLRVIHYYNDLLAMIASIITNLLLLVMIMKRTTIEMKPYSRILLQTCVLDLFLTFATFITKIQIEIDQGSYLLTITGFFDRALYPWNLYLILFYVYALYFCILSTPIPFFYRYLLICREKVLSRLWFLFMYFFTALATISITILTGLALAPTDTNYPNVIVDDFWKDKNENLPIFVVVDLTNKFLIIMLGYVTIINSIAYMLMIWCSGKIWRRLSATKHLMSQKTRIMHRQLTYALVAQAISPLVTAFIPIIFIAASLLLRIKLDGIGIVVMIFLAWITFLNPAVTLFVVTPYRKSILFRIRSSNVVNLT